MILDAIPRFAPKRQLEKLLQRKETEFERIVGVVRIVSDTVSRIHGLHFQKRGPWLPAPCSWLFLCSMSLTFQNFAGKIQPRKFRIRRFDQFENSQRLRVVVETAV